MEFLEVDNQILASYSESCVFFLPPGTWISMDVFWKRNNPQFILMGAYISSKWRFACHEIRWCEYFWDWYLHYWTSDDVITRTPQDEFCPLFDWTFHGGHIRSMLFWKKFLVRWISSPWNTHVVPPWPHHREQAYIVCT